MPMKRHLVAGVLGLALAGCAQSRSALPNRGAPSLGPVGLTTFPSIHESINRENPRVDPIALREGVVPNGGRGGPTMVYLDERTGVASVGPGPEPALGQPAAAMDASQPPAPGSQYNPFGPRVAGDATAPAPPDAPASPGGPAPIQLERANQAGLDPPPTPVATTTEVAAGPPPAASPAPEATAPGDEKATSPADA